jgi:hypothetical protein
MLADPHPDCHSTVALHGATRARTAAATTAEASRGNSREGSGEGGAVPAVTGHSAGEPGAFASWTDRIM